MGSKPFSRRDFLKKFGNGTTQEKDVLFEKYSRKKLGQRYYSDKLSNRDKVNIPDEADNDNGPAERNGNVTSGLTPYTGPWTEWEVMHLLRRTSFGVKRADVDTLTAMSTSAAVDWLLTYPTTPVLPSATPLNHYANVLSGGQPIGDSSGVPLDQDWTNSYLEYLSGAAGQYDTLIAERREQGLMCWSWGIAFQDATSIREKMTHFWYHFIPISFTDIRSEEVKGNAPNAAYHYMRLLRDNALGNFKTLIKSIAKTPAMLIYLSNQYSTAAAPNENFARELLELFTMGKVPVQNYEEADIVAASKVLSGWRVPNFGGPSPHTVVFDPAYHNQADKVFGAYFGNTIIYNQPGSNGANEFDELFDMIFTQQATTIAKYICRRLYRYFVYYDIDANIETNVIVPLAATFQASNWNILPVITQLLKSEHFFDMANRGVMIKSPFDLLTGTLRTLDIDTTAVATSVPQVVNQYNVWLYFHNKARLSLEQGYGLVPNVSGWKAYYQAPTFYQNWINSNTIQQRASILNLILSSGGITQGNTSMKFNAVAWVSQFNIAVSDPDILVSHVIKYMLPVDVSAATKEELKINNLLAGQITNNYWTSAWNNYINNPSNNNYFTVVKNRLMSLFSSIAQFAEYQLM